MSYWDGYTSTGGERVMVLGATNRPYDLDEAILRRMPQQIFFGLPDAGERESILRIYLPRDRIDPTILPTIYSHLAKLTDEYNGSDLKEFCKCAAMQPMREYARQYRGKHLSKAYSCDDSAISLDRPKLRLLQLHDFQHALERIKPTGREAMDHLKGLYIKQLGSGGAFSSLQSTSHNPLGAYVVADNPDSPDGVPHPDHVPTQPSTPLSKPQGVSKPRISAKNLLKHSKQFRIKSEDLDSDGTITNSGLEKLYHFMNYV
uniref:ATPase family AAA domain-containing protein 1-A n=1 Tax=Lygus hesperus TaxID=30085 RepID=A0A0A9XL29_LYGHE